jgi:hypothetical protein
MSALHRIRTEALDIPLENASSLLDSIRLTFVMGCPRSGTTFLLRALAGLPRTQAWAGILIPDRLCHVIASGQASAGVVQDLLYSCRAALWKTFVNTILSRRYHLRGAVASRSAFSPSARILLGSRALDVMDFGMVYKEPFMALAAEELARHFSRARFIHLIRDGRDCADSMERTYGAALTDAVLDASKGRWREVGSEIGTGRAYRGMIVPWWIPDEDAARFLDASRYERYLWMWKECVTRARRSAPIAAERYLEVRYEDLCSDPVAVGGRLLEFVGVESSRRFRKAMDTARTSSIGVARKGGAGREAAWEPAASLLRELGYAVP